MSMTKSGVSIHTLTERGSDYGRSTIDSLVTMVGKTFSKDPYVSGMFTHPVDVKMKLTVKAHIHGASDPNFFIMYLRDDEEIGATAVTNAAAATTVQDEDAFKCCGIFNVGRDQGGMPTSIRLYFLLFLYCIPYIFSWGLRGFINCLKSAYTEIYRAYVYGEMADHLGIKMTDCYQMEYLATDLKAVGKGYGSLLIKAIHEKADADKKHIILYSSSKRNIQFYKRHGYDVIQDYGENCMLLYRRCQEQN